MIRRLIGQAGINHSSPKVRSLQAYLADRVTKRAWTLPQVASELGIHPDTVRDRLDRDGLRRTKLTAR